MEDYLAWTSVRAAARVWSGRVLTELRTMDSLTATSLAIFGCTVVCLVAISAFFQWRLRRLLVRTHSVLRQVDDHLEAKRTTQAFLFYLLDLAKKSGDSMNMAMHMSEMRKKSRDQRSPRPKNLRDRTPEFLPGLHAQRCQKDGVAVLKINEVEELSEDNKLSDNSTKDTYMCTTRPVSEDIETERLLKVTELNTASPVPEKCI